MFRLVECRLMVKKEFQINEGSIGKNSLFYITKGKMRYSMAGKNESAGVEDFVFFPCKTYFEREVTETLEFYHVRFENSDEIPLEAGKIFVRDKARLLSTLNYLCNLELMPDGNEEMKNYFLNDIFVQLKANNLMTNAENDGVVRGAIVYFKKNLNKKISLEEIANEAGVSVSGLIGHFKTATGMTPLRYLNALRIKKSETLLCHSDSSISEIALECGFDNSYYFCNTFKKYNGIAPTVYRKKYGI